MRAQILKLNRLKVVIIITIASVISAVSLDLTIAYFLGWVYNTNALVRSFVIPLFIAPFASWYFVGLLFKVDKIKREMYQMASYDDLTGVLNRRMVYEKSENFHSKSLKNNCQYSVIVFDIDDFKKINDNNGHVGGDKVLENLGSLCLSLNIGDCIVGRTGGDEFAILLQNKDVNEAVSVSEQLMKKIKMSEVAFNKKAIGYSISVGITENLNCEETSVKQTFYEADQALYKSKKDGGNTINVF